jgi:hypothetical protein
LSQVAGIMDSKTLRFRKTYFGKNGGVYDYDFELNPQGVWVGKYRLVGPANRKHEGSTVCKTDCFSDDCPEEMRENGTACSPLDLIKNAPLEMSKGAKTGKRTVIPHEP